MRRIPFVALSLALLSAAGAPAAILDHPHVAGELIVSFRAGTSLAAQDAVHARLGAAVLRHGIDRDWALLHFADGAPLEDHQSAYLAEASVESAEPNYIGQGGLAPNDTFYGDQWHHSNTGQSGGTPGADIEAEAGWDLVTPDPAVVVAVLDTGIDTDHPEFAGRIAAGWDYVNADSIPEDDNGHGTWASGLLAANQDNGFGVSGVDGACMIMPVKVLNSSGMGTTANLISGIDFARLAGVDVVSMSLINYPLGFNLNTALKAARQAGIVLIACAGNGGIGDADVSAPGNSSETISIGATDHNDVRASYSGTGTALEYVAPGDNVVTVAYDTAADTSVPFAGCSAATPVAAGIASLLRSLDPGLNNRTMRTYLTAGAEDQVGDPLEDTAGRDDFMGRGRLNLRASIDAYLSVVAVPEAEAIAAGLGLDVRPNPSDGPVRVTFSLPAPDRVRAVVHDVSGRRVRTLGHGVRPAGVTDVRWDGRDDGGAPVASGVYFVRVESRHVTETRKVTLTR